MVERKRRKEKNRAERRGGGERGANKKIVQDKRHEKTSGILVEYLRVNIEHRSLLLPRLILVRYT